MATEENYSIDITVSQPTLNMEGGDLSQTMRITFGQWFRGDVAHPDWNENDEEAEGYIRNKPAFIGEDPVVVEQADGAVSVSLSASLMETLLAITEAFWLSPFRWGSGKQWKS